MTAISSSERVPGALRRFWSHEARVVRMEPEPTRAPWFALAAAAWFGLLTSFIELGFLLVRNALSSSASLGALQMNRHFFWMIPLSHLAIFLAGGVAFGLLGLVRPRLSRRVALVGSCALGIFSLLILINGLHALGASVLAIGLASRIAPRIEQRIAGFRRVMAISLPVFLGVVAILAWLGFERLVRAEARALASLPKARAGAPNVLLVVLDTVRADRLSLHGYDRNTTPNLDRLARRGIVFKEARSTAPWTLPSHASMLTGRWPHELKVGDNHPLDGAYPTLAEFLGERGYATAGFIGNTYYCNSWYGLGRGFVHYEDYYEHNIIISPGEALHCTALGRRLIEALGGYYNARPGAANMLKDAERVNRDTLAWLGANPARPYFAFLNYIDVHDPYQTPPTFTRNFGLKPDKPEDLELISDLALHRQESGLGA